MIATEENFINETFLVERATYNIQLQVNSFSKQSVFSRLRKLLSLSCSCIRYARMSTLFHTLN